MTYKHIKAYEANDVKSLNDLKFSFQRDEAKLIAQIVSVTLAKIDNKTDATAVIYNEVGILADINLGHLIIDKYTTEVDKLSRIANHKTKGETFICEGAAYINSQPTKILVFREKGD